MQSLLRFRTSRFARLRPHISLPTTLPARAVWLTYVASVAVLFAFVCRNVSRVPIHDEFSSFRFVFAEPRPPLSQFWVQHNEHRIPLPRLLYVAAVRLAGNDFRGPPVLNVFLLTAATGFLLLVVLRLRGKLVVADALIPLALLGVGQYENLLWGFQIQFVSSTVLVLVALGLVAMPDLAHSPSRLIGLGACGAMLPLCGANGVALAPGIALSLLFVAAWNVWDREREWTTGLVAGAAAIAVVTVVLAYFRGLEQPAHHANAHGTPTQMIVGFVNLFGSGFGPVGRYMQPHPYEGVTLFGAVGIGLVALTSLRLLRGMANPTTRIQAVGLGGVLVGFIGLAGGLALGRSGLLNVLDVNRYVTLMLPAMVGAYVAWVAVGRNRWVPTALFAIVATATIPNAVLGIRGARTMMETPRQIEYHLKAGIPLEFIADRNPHLYFMEPKFRRVGLEMLRANGVAPFRIAAPMPQLQEKHIPLRVLRSEGVAADGTGYRVTSETGHVVFAMPRRQNIYGLKLTYEGTAGAMAGMPNVISWEHDGQPPTSASSGVVGQLEPLTAPNEILIYVNREADTFRVDVFGAGARFTVHSLAILTLAE